MHIDNTNGGKDLGATLGDTISGTFGLTGEAVKTVEHIAGEWVDLVLGHRGPWGDGDKRNLAQTLGDTIAGAVGLGSDGIKTVGKIGTEWIDLILEGGHHKDH